MLLVEMVTSIPLPFVRDLFRAFRNGPGRHDLNAAAQLHHVAMAASSFGLTASAFASAASSTRKVSES